MFFLNLKECDTFMKNYGVINEEGTEIHIWGFTNDMGVMKLLSDEELEKIKEDRESAEAPECAYFKSQPNNPGKLFWISGTIFLLYAVFIGTERELHSFSHCGFRSTRSR